MVAEYSGRSEHEVIPDLKGLSERVFLGAGNCKMRRRIHSRGRLSQFEL
jgi:hypothetical protein